MARYYQAAPGQGNDPVASLILVVLAIFFPPAVPLIMSGCGADFCINLLLTILAFFPGCIHALWLIYKQAKANEQYGQAGYIYAGNGHYQPAHGGQHQPSSYGATAPGPQHPHQHPHQQAYNAPPPQSGYTAGREPWEGAQQQQHQGQAPPPPNYTKK